MYLAADLLDSAVNKISDAEGQLASGSITTAQRDSQIADALSKVQPGQLVIFGSLMIGLIIALYAGAYCCMHFGYKLDEAQYNKIVDELEARHAADIAAAEAAASAPQAAMAAAAPSDNPTPKV
jgi:hypothetical protein